MRVIDLSYPVRGGMPVYPGEMPVTLTLARELARDGYNGFALSASLHAGTHIDAPYHLSAQPAMIGDFDAGRFFGRGVLIDAQGQPLIEMKEAYRDLIAPGDIVLIYSGWDAHWERADYFTDHPVVDPALAAFLCERGVSLLGMDMPSPDRAPFVVHRRLLDQDILLIENMANLAQLRGVQDFHVCAFPLKIAAEGSPVRAVALVG